MRCILEDEPLTLKCHSCWLLQLYEAFEAWNSCLWPSLELTGHKEVNFFFFSFLFKLSSLLLLLILWCDACQPHGGGRR